MTSVRIYSILALLCLLLGQKVKKRILSAVKIIGKSDFTGGLRSGTSNVKPARPAYRLSGTSQMKWFSASSFVQPENDLYTFPVSMSLLPCSDVQGKLMKYGINDLPAGIPAAVNQPEKN
jgi:hypothetical protein